VLCCAVLGVDNAANAVFVERTRLYDCLVEYFPDSMTQPRANLTDMVSLHWCGGVWTDSWPLSHIHTRMHCAVLCLICGLFLLLNTLTAESYSFTIFWWICWTSSTLGIIMWGELVLQFFLCILHCTVYIYIYLLYCGCFHCNTVLELFPISMYHPLFLLEPKKLEKEEKGNKKPAVYSFS